MTKLKNFTRRARIRTMKSGNVMLYGVIGYNYENIPAFTLNEKLEDGETLDGPNWEIKGNDVKAIWLRSIRDRIDRAFVSLSLQDKVITARAIYDVAFADRIVVQTRLQRQIEKEQKKEKTLAFALDHLLAQSQKEFDGGLITWDNLRKQRGHASLIKEWARQEFDQANVLLSAIKPGHLKNLLLWGKTEKGFVHNYAAYVAKFFKRAMAHSQAYGFIVSSPFLTIIIKKEISRGEHLTAAEVRKLEEYNARLLGEPMQVALDCFLWQVYTGASYSDAMALKPSDIFRDTDGVDYLKYQRNKVKKKGVGWAIVPIMPNAQALIDKYQNHPLVLKDGTLMPGRCYDKTNKRLGIIAKLAGIEKKVTTHVARRTFATLYLNDGVQLATVSKMLGHSGSVVTQRHYAEMHPEGIIREMRPFLTDKAV